MKVLSIAPVLENPLLVLARMFNLWFRLKRCPNSFEEDHVNQHMQQQGLHYICGLGNWSPKTILCAMSILDCGPGNSRTKTMSMSEFAVRSSEYRVLLLKDYHP